MGQTLISLDSGNMSKTPEGYLDISGVKLTKTGLFTYHENGEFFLEKRTDEEVFNKDSLETIKNKPLSLGHYENGITTDNAKGITVGVIQGNVRAEKPYIVGDVRIFSADAIEKIEKGEVQAISMEYTRERVETNEKGVKYMQKDIEYQGGALVRETRAGKGCRLLSLDEGVEVTEEEFKKQKSKITALEKSLDEKNDEISTLEITHRAELKKRDKEIEQLKEEKEKQSKKSLDSVEFLNLYNERNSLVELHKEHLQSKDDISKKSNLELKKEVVKSFDEEVNLDEMSEKELDIYLKVIKKKGGDKGSSQAHKNNSKSLDGVNYLRDEDLKIEPSGSESYQNHMDKLDSRSTENG